MVAAEPSQARKAALLLHGLEPAALQQVMARLAPLEAARLQPMLAELNQLGIPRSFGTALDARERVALMSPEQVALGLQSCAAATAARLIEARQWPWRTAVLNCMTEAHRVAVSSRLRSANVGLAPAVLDALCEQLCAAADRSRAVEARTNASLALLNLRRALRRIFQ